MLDSSLFKSQVKNTLHMWARWSRINNPKSKLGYPNQTSFERIRRGTLKKSSFNQSYIDEEVAERADRLIANLSLIYKKEIYILKLKYIYMLSHEEIAKETNLSIYKVKSLFSHALTSVQTIFWLENSNFKRN